MKKLILFLGLLIFASKTDVALAIDPTQLIPDSSQNGIVLNTMVGTSATINFGRTGYNANEAGFIYTPVASHWVCQIDFKIYKSGNPTDSVRTYVRQNVDTNDLLSGDPYYVSQNVWMGTDFVESPSYTSSYWYGTQSPPGNCFPVHKDTNYSFYVKRTGALNSTDYYYMLVNYGEDESAEANYCSNLACTNNLPWVTIYGIVNGSSLDNTTVDTSSFCENLGVFTTACETLVFMFVPNVNTVQNDITDLYDDFSEKAPFGYITEALNLDFSNVSTGSGVPSFTIPINVEVQESTILDTSFSWSDSQSQNIVANYASQIRSIFIILIWLSFVFYLFALVRHIL